MAKSILSEIQSFLSDEEKVTLEIEFKELESLYQQGVKGQYLPSKRDSWKVFIDKSSLFDNATFYFRDAPKFVFSLTVDNEFLSYNLNSKEIKAERFAVLGQEPIGGKRIIISEHLLTVEVYIKNGTNLFDVSTLAQYYSSPVSFKSYEHKLDFKTLFENPKGSDNCYIATLVYNDIEHPRVVLLRNYRDTVLAKNILGKQFIKFYYAYSPKLVEILKPYSLPQRIIKKILDSLTNKMA